jgi:hypothetical protein
MQRGVMKKITTRWLKKKRACSFAVKDFEKLFGKECEVNYENFLLWREKRYG